MKEMTGYKCDICGNIFTEEDYKGKQTAKVMCEDCEKSHKKIELFKPIYLKGYPYPTAIHVLFEGGSSVRYDRQS